MGDVGPVAEGAAAAPRGRVVSDGSDAYTAWIATYFENRAKSLARYVATATLDSEDDLAVTMLLLKGVGPEDRARELIRAERDRMKAFEASEFGQKLMARWRADSESNNQARGDGQHPGEPRE